MPARRSARFLAPLALVAFVIVLVIVLSSAAGGGSGSKSSTTKGRATTTTTRARPHTKPSRYVVQASDTSLDSIARKTGVPADRLLELNPNLDPQSLVPGQALKLR